MSACPNKVDGPNNRYELLHKLALNRAKFHVERCIGSYKFGLEREFCIISDSKGKIEENSIFLRRSLERDGFVTYRGLSFRGVRELFVALCNKDELVVVRTEPWEGNEVYIVEALKLRGLNCDI